MVDKEMSKTQLKQGLSSQQALELLAKFNFNEIEQPKKSSPFWLLLEQFKGPLVIILLFACGISIFLGELVESLAIAAILILNALIGFFQEYRAENAISELSQLTAPRATVIRDSKQQVILAREVVPGDLLLLEAGDLVAADGVLQESSHLQVNEAVLTGESVFVNKQIKNSEADQVFMGTNVTNGTAICQVKKTGMSTELGKIAHMLSTAKVPATPLQQELSQLGKVLLIICISVVVLVGLHGLLQGQPLFDVLVYSLSLAVAAVPEGMPAIVTVALAAGVQRMAAQKALVKKLPSVETLGSVSVICTDKTGTLTTGKMRVRKLWPEGVKNLLRVASACCDAELSNDGKEGTGDTTEVAILLAAWEQGIKKEEIEKVNPRLSTYPFDSERKRMSVWRTDQRLYVKGALESLLPLCLNSVEFLQQADQANQKLSAKGLRVLAVALGSQQEEQNLELVGLLAIADPPRKEVEEALKEAQQAGIIPIMITGDYALTAHAIAQELGLAHTPEEFKERVYARAKPEDKMQLIRQWKDRNAIVAMTGDGVNDAPALKEAHIGIAMGKTGTEVTRQAADLILADDNFATIIKAVKEGRGIYANIRKAIVYLLIGNLAELLIVSGAALMSLPVPFLSYHLLWINLVTDSLPALALIADPVDPSLMQKPPRSLKEHILGKAQLSYIFQFGVIEALVTLGVFAWYEQQGSEALARTMAFATLVCSQIFRSFGARSPEKIFWKLGTLTNPWLLLVIGISLLTQFLLHTIPLSQKVFGLVKLSFLEIVIITLLALIPVTLIELRKLLRKKKIP